MSIKDSRREYQYSTLTRESLLKNPFDQFRLWMEQAIDDDIVDPTAMSVACLLYTSPSPRDMRRSRMPSSA